MRYIIVAGFAIIGTFLGGAVGLAVVDSPGWLVFVYFVVGGYGGTMIARFLLRCITPKGRLKGPTHEVNGDSVPLPFGERLRQFVGGSGYGFPHHNTHFASSMPFWSLRDAYMKTPPKSPRIIRRILYRIRDILSGATPPKCDN